MTSNIGSNLIRENFEKINQSNHDEIVEKTKNQVFELLKQNIRPEFLNRVDELIMFSPLNESQIENIVKLQLSNIQKLLSENSVHLEISEKAIKYIAHNGFDPQFGARPVKRAIQKLLLNDLSKDLLAGKVTNNTIIHVDVNEDGKLVFIN
ncbi:Chaperone protein ClpB [bioreactor metagenome]|uniref:Chaperone protein ClpB n=1 Tax=bioreactor metagenome TaxID=1076179 RepID=A0A645GBI2_9ZZZZ